MALHDWLPKVVQDSIIVEIAYIDIPDPVDSDRAGPTEAVSYRALGKTGSYLNDVCILIASWQWPINSNQLRVRT